MKIKWPGLFLLIAGLFAIVGFCRAQGLEAAPLQVTPAITRTVIDSLGQALKHNYVFPDTAAKWAAWLDEEYRKGAYAAIRDPQEPVDKAKGEIRPGPI